MGEKVHLSTNYIGLIERNVDTPSLSAIIDIANELGVSLDYLVGTHIKKKKKIIRNVGNMKIKLLKR